MTSLCAALALLFQGFACTMNTKIISRKDCKGAQFHFPFWKEKQLCQGWTAKPKPLFRKASWPKRSALGCRPMQMGQSRQEAEWFIE